MEKQEEESRIPISDRWRICLITYMVQKTAAYDFQDFSTIAFTCTRQNTPLYDILADIVYTHSK